MDKFVVQSSVSSEFCMSPSDKSHIGKGVKHFYFDGLVHLQVFGQ